MRTQEGEESEAHGRLLGLFPAPFTGPQGRRVPDTRVRVSAAREAVARSHLLLAALHTTEPSSDRNVPTLKTERQAGRRGWGGQREGRLSQTFLGKNKRKFQSLERQLRDPARNSDPKEQAFQRPVPAHRGSQAGRGGSGGLGPAILATHSFSVQRVLWLPTAMPRAEEIRVPGFWRTHTHTHKL